jgi:hypothetical protein
MPELDDGTWVFHRPYVAPTLPEPIVRSVVVAADDERVPRDARSLARKIEGAILTYARGYVAGADGGPAMSSDMEPTGEMTEGSPPKPQMKNGQPTGKMTRGSAPRPAMRKVNEVQKPPADSLRLVVRIGDLTYVGHWLDGGWDHGMILRGRTLVGNPAFRQWSKEVKDAASRENVRGEDGQGVLPLEGDEGKPV